MKLLITGAAGFIGSRLCEYILSHHQGDKILCLDVLTYAGNIDNISDFKDNPDFTFVKGNINDSELVSRLLRDFSPDAVINLAAESHVDRSIKSPRIFFETNLLGTQTLLDCCVKNGISRFHQVSTDEVYGSSANCSAPFDEQSPLCPTNPYAASKAGADLAALSYAKTYGMSVTISRSCNNYGKNQHTEKLIPMTVTNALNDRPVPIYGDGSGRRCWLNVSDCCAAIDMILRKCDSGIYNIGSENELDNLNLAKMILDILNKPHSLIKFAEDRKAHDMRYLMKYDKIKTELSWSEQIPFAQGLLETVEHYADKRSGKL